ncbi:MAG: phosphatidylglycerophosphatase A [Gammaproteobacteria bacterium]|nr:phosphatidylglycerophosphatase A [Gammaproteobacteria bacterium]
MKNPAIKLTNPVHFFATGFGAGLLPFAPGTWGTVVAIPIYFLMQMLPLYFYGPLIVLFFGVGVWICDITMRDLGVYDHPSIVWDEVVGYLLTMIIAPVSIIWAIVGFALFRLFDIWKPWPINLVDEKLQNGLGIMLDDVLAAIYAAFTLELIVWLKTFLVTKI